MTVTLQERYVVTARLRPESFGVLAFKTRPALELLLLNHSAMEVLSLCNGENDLARIINAISRQYHGVAGDRIQRDICALLSDLQERGIIECCNPTISQ